MSMTQTDTGTLAFPASASTRAARSLASVSKSITYLLPRYGKTPSHERVNLHLLGRTDERLAPQFTHIESQAVFCISRLVKALVEQLLHFLLRGRPRDRVYASIPPCGHFDVGRQAGGVYQALGIADGPLFERADPSGERIDKGVELGIRERPIHVAVAFSQIAWDVLRT